MLHILQTSLFAMRLIELCKFPAGIANSLSPVKQPGPGRKVHVLSADSSSHPALALDPVSKTIVHRLQAHIPLVPRPFLAIANELLLPEDEVLERTQALIDDRVIREIGAIFNGRALGYDSCLVAAKYAPHDLEAAARVISAHPGVSHNYQRTHDFNLWYTLAVPPQRRLTDEVDLLHRLSGAESTRALPAVRIFKLSVKLDMDETPSDTRSSEAVSVAETGGSQAPTEEEVAAVRAFQEPFVISARPFDAPAARHGFASAEALLEVGGELLRRGALRRFSAVLRHREAGFGANGMAVWKASPEECAVAGPIMASFAKVSHCYQRQVYEDWPYSLFTMIHGRTSEEVDDCISALRRETGLREYQVLYSPVEYKKARVRYFSDAWATWRHDAEAAARGGPA
jgi:siroheme decarboxylase